jgi:hypothetical protein
MNLYLKTIIVSKIKKLEKSIELAILCGEKDHVVNHYEAKRIKWEIKLVELETKDEIRPII